MLPMTLRLAHWSQIMLINTLEVIWDSLIEMIKDVNFTHDLTHLSLNLRTFMLKLIFESDQAEIVRL